MRLSVRPSSRVLLVGLTVGALLLAGLAAGADAGAAALSAPAGGRVSAVSATSFTVGLPPVPGATSYRVLASTTRSDVYAENYHRRSSHRLSATASRPSVRLAGLRFTSAPYYYRVLAVHGSSIRWSPTIGEVGLRPARPTGLTARSGAYLIWSAGAATGSRIEQADNSSFTRGVRLQSVRGTTHVYTPYGLAAGRTYWFRVRSTEVTTPSAASAAVRLTAAHAQSTLRVMTYNLLVLRYDGTSEGGQTIAPWSARRLAAATLIDQAAPAVVAVQEGWGLIDSVDRPRSQACTTDAKSYHYVNRHDTAHEYLQVDSLCDALGDRYRRVDNSTDATRGSDLGRRHAGLGNYLLYDPTRVAPVAGASGFWNLGPGALYATDQRTAAFAVFRVLATGAQVLVTSAHPVAQAGARYDRIRAAQTASLLTQARTVAAARPVVSIVYAGDFNAYPGRTGATDTPGAAMRAVGAADSLQAAASVHHGSYNSTNEYRRTPPQHGGSVDHVFVTPGTGVRSWNQVLTLSRGRFAGTMPSDHNPVYVDLALPRA